MEPKTIKIDDIEYVRKEEAELKQAKNTNGLKYCIIRTYSAGVHAGYLESREGKEVKLINSRRLWRWSGAASLSQLAVDGVSQPEDCKFPCELDEITLTEAIEIIPCTEKARKSIASVKVWEV